MRIRIGSGLLLLNLLVILLVAAIIIFPSGIFRIILGLPFVLFFPGYTLILALYPRKGGIGGVERVALSFGSSIAVVPLIGMVLNYTRWGITLESVLYTTAAFIFIMSLVALLRRRRLSKEERFEIEIQLTWRGWGESAWNKVLSIILVLSVVGALGVLAYTVTTPKVEETFTEFYILGPEGKAEDYPLGLSPGETGQVTVGIINREHEPVSYRVEVAVDGVKNNELSPVMLEHDEEREQLVGFTPDEVGAGQQVQFLLYKGADVKPYLVLYLWIDVNG